MHLGILREFQNFFLKLWKSCRLISPYIFRKKSYLELKKRFEYYILLFSKIITVNSGIQEETRDRRAKKNLTFASKRIVQQNSNFDSSMPFELLMQLLLILTR